MEIFLFRGGVNPDLIGYALDREAVELPTEHGPWTLVGLSSARDLETMAPADTPLGQGLKSRRFFLADQFLGPFSAGGKLG
jgi:hypothetical protein